MVKSLIPHFGIALPLGGSHIPKWQKKGRAARGGCPRAALVACFVYCLAYCLLLASFYVDLVVS